MTDKSKPSKQAIEIAAQCWGDPRVSNRVMDTELGIVFAEQIDKQLCQLTELQASLDEVCGSIPPAEMAAWLEQYGSCENCALDLIGFNDRPYRVQCEDCGTRQETDDTVAWRAENIRLREAIEAMSSIATLEMLAAIEHERWSGWMRHMFDNWTPEDIARWKHQMMTPYADLPEYSKEADRVEVRKTLTALAGVASPDATVIDPSYAVDGKKADHA